MLSLHNQSYLQKSLFWLTILKGEPRMMGTKGSRWPEKEAERMSVGLSVMLPPARIHTLKVL